MYNNDRESNVYSLLFIIVIIDVIPQGLHQPVRVEINEIEKNY